VTPGHRPQIDALRALAVLGVLAGHFIWSNGVTAQLGVRLFCVITGFLITERLLEARATLPPGAAGPGPALRRFYLRRFYLRRALRILPAYWLVLAALTAADAQGFRAGALWHLFFLSNIRAALTGSWEPWVAAHLWAVSLGVQFYLVWPLLVLRLPGRMLAPAIGAVGLAGILFRFGLVVGWPVDPAAPAIWVLPPASADALAAGALLSLGVARRVATVWIERAGCVAAALWLAGVGLVAADLMPAPAALTYAGGGLLDMIVFAGLVALADRGAGGLAGSILTLPLLLGLGRISYGVYLFHLPALALLARLGLATHHGVVLFFAAGAATVAIALASWHMVERPFLGLKERRAP